MKIGLSPFEERIYIFLGLTPGFQFFACACICVWWWEGRGGMTFLTDQVTLFKRNLFAFHLI